MSRRSLVVFSSHSRKNYTFPDKDHEQTAQEAVRIRFVLLRRIPTGTIFSRFYRSTEMHKESDRAWVLPRNQSLLAHAQFYGRFR